MKKILVTLMVLLFVFSSVYANATQETVAPAPAPVEEAPAEVAPVEEVKAPAEVKADKKLVYSISSLGGKFSPFFYTTAYDGEVCDMFSMPILTADRGGAIVENAIEGEWREYNGTDYFYQGIGDIAVDQFEDGKTDYRITMRDDIKFSDGSPMTIDDLIFSMYVACDPTYDGSSTLYALPIIGMDDYRSSMQTAESLIYAAGEDNTDFSLWSEELQKKFWEAVPAAGELMAQEIIDSVDADYGSDDAYCQSYVGASSEEVAADPDLQIQLGFAMWGYGDAYFEGATAADYWKAIVDAYDGDPWAAADVELADSTLLQLIEKVTDGAFLYPITISDVRSISGFEKTGDYSMTVHCSEFSAVTIYQLAQVVCPLHYYGDPALYNGVDSFGFPKGDLSLIKDKTSAPLGAGPYVFESYKNGVVTFKANPYYFLGEPETKTILFQEASDADFVPGIITGTFDIALPSISSNTLNAIQDANDNGEIVGNTVTTYLVDFRGYGYLGINANLVSVGGEAGSEASKNLRRALMTLLAVYRDTVINSYYGDRASVIQYPISNTSWAAPQPTDEGYRIAYSKDVDGNDIYSAAMSDPEKYDAALEAAIGFLKAAGYTWDDEIGKFTAAPEGAKMEYEALIPGDGNQDHPAYGVAIGAAEALEKIGLTLSVNDCTSTTWTNALEANTAEIWAAAWQSTVDPDMYQVYHSSNANGLNTNSNHYQIVSDYLDDLIIKGRASSDTDYRKATYKAAMEEIIDWAVELPTYQRKECTTTSTIRVDNDTMPRDMTPYWGWKAEVDKLAAK